MEDFSSLKHGGNQEINQFGMTNPHSIDLQSTEIAVLKDIITQTVQYTAFHFQNSNVFTNPHTLTIFHNDDSNHCKLELNVVTVPCLCASNYTNRALHVQVHIKQIQKVMVQSFEQRNYTTTDILFQKPVFRAAREASQRYYQESAKDPESIYNMGQPIEAFTRIQVYSAAGITMPLESLGSNTETPAFSSFDQDKTKAIFQKDTKFTDVQDTKVINELMNSCGIDHKTLFGGYDQEILEDDSGDTLVYNANSSMIENYENSIYSDDEQTVADGCIDPELRALMPNVEDMEYTNTQHSTIFDKIEVPPQGIFFIFGLLPDNLLNGVFQSCKICHQNELIHKLESESDNCAVPVFLLKNYRYHLPNFIPMESPNGFYTDRKVEQSSEVVGGYNKEDPYRHSERDPVNLASQIAVFDNYEQVCEIFQKFRVVSMFMEQATGNIPLLNLVPRHHFYQEVHSNMLSGTQKFDEASYFRLQQSQGFPRNELSYENSNYSPISSTTLLESASHEPLHLAHEIDVTMRDTNFYDSDSISTECDPRKNTIEDADTAVENPQDGVDGYCQVSNDWYKNANKVAEKRLCDRLARQLADSIQAEELRLAALQHQSITKFVCTYEMINSNQIAPQTMKEETRELWVPSNDPDNLSHGAWGTPHRYMRKHCQERVRIVRKQPNGLMRFRVEGRVTQEAPVRIYNVQPFRLRMFYEVLSLAAFGNNETLHVAYGRLYAELAILRQQPRHVTSIERQNFRRFKEVSVRTQQMKDTLELKSSIRQRASNQVMRRTKIPEKWRPRKGVQNCEFTHGHLKEKSVDSVFYHCAPRFRLPKPSTVPRINSPLIQIVSKK